MVQGFITSFVAIDFPSRPKRWTGLLNFTAADLAHALMATGRAPGDVLAHGIPSMWEFIHRVSVIPAYLEVDPSSRRIMRSDLALSLDRSEKVGLSYAIGQAMTGIFSEHKLDVDFLMHVDRYERTFNVRFAPGRTRADLFGFSTSGWVVAEAKGRSNAPEAGLDSKLRSQKRSIKFIDGSKPSLALGCVSSFPPPNGHMRLDLVDPEPDEATSVALQADRDRFLLAYYLPFATAINSATERSAQQLPDLQSQTEYAVGSYPEVGFSLGLPEEIVDFVLRYIDRPADVSGLSEVVDRVIDLSARGGGTHRDGSFFVVDWELAEADTSGRQYG